MQRKQFFSSGRELLLFLMFPNIRDQHSTALLFGLEIVFLLNLKPDLFNSNFHNLN